MERQAVAKRIEMVQGMIFWQCNSPPKYRRYFLIQNNAMFGFGSGPKSGLSRGQTPWDISKAEENLEVGADVQPILS